MKEQYTRTALLFGDGAIDKLKASRVAVFGIGGVGGAAVEALARAGVGTIDLIDSDKVSESNINRQIIALHSTVGMDKTEAARSRIADIDPDITVNCHNIFFLPENAEEFDFSSFDYIIDAIDTVSGKLALIEGAVRAGVPVISSMGTGNKVDPSLLCVSDVYKTSVCPLAKVMRRELKARGIKKLKVVWSPEEPRKTSAPGDAHRRSIPASCSFVPPVAGYILAGEVIKDLVNDDKYSEK
ncbi:MAG: tRNA threonylcarbamoyladenosine dehydratase [Ruminococcaceae bacterium]|nr:tRNA threonylcarbamoyladenosine dehydratase [Oscillospiraceae bacterium]